MNISTNKPHNLNPEPYSVCNIADHLWAQKYSPSHYTDIQLALMPAIAFL